MVNAFTVDLEDWYHICDIEGLSDPSKWDAYETRVLKNTDKVLSLLRRHETRATFFVLGYIAHKEPGLIKAIRGEGHEIATHGFFHRRVFEMTESEFEEDVRRSIEAITSATGEGVLGFRAPEWSMRESTPWALGSLRKMGILYDSSMVPLTRMGDRSCPRFPRAFNTPHGDIWEFPLTTARAFREGVPFTGGLPLRITPYFYVVSKISRINSEGKPCMVYIHPWEFDTDQPKIDLPMSRRFMHYFNIQATPRKVEALLGRLKFAPVRDVLGLGR